MADIVESISTETVNDERVRICIQCGDCSGICPVGHLMEYPPSRIIAAIRSDNFQQAAQSEKIWLCVACSACSSVCPAQIPITQDIMSRIKEGFLLAGEIPDELQDALESTQRYGNPFGESPRKRIDWIKGRENKIPIFGKGIQQADYLWFVGDYASYHPEAQAASQAFAEILNRLEINFAILGNDEFSDCDSQRLAGEFGLFEMMAEKNAKVMRRYKFNQIITTDPHAYNALKNEYPKLGITYPVQHYTEFLYKKIETIIPLLTTPLQAKVTYHDPCYLGRVNKVFDAPRAILTAIPGVSLVEMGHSKNNSLCCGGGGGGMWLDGYLWDMSHIRLSEWRVKEAVKTGATILAIACPYEAPRFIDGIKTMGAEEKLSVKDIAELIWEAMK
jgi:dimethylglycine catabolism B